MDSCRSCPLGRDANIWQAKRARICKPRPIPCMGPRCRRPLFTHLLPAASHHGLDGRATHLPVCAVRCPLCCAVLCRAMGAVPVVRCLQLAVLARWSWMFPSLRQTGGGEKTTLASLDPTVNIGHPIYKYHV